MDELSEDDKLTVSRARKIQKFLSQPFTVAEVFTGKEGKLVPLDVSVWVCVRVCVCVHVHVCARERERVGRGEERRGGEIKRECVHSWEREGERESVCVCVCVCV